MTRSIAAMSRRTIMALIVGLLLMVASTATVAPRKPTPQPTKSWRGNNNADGMPSHNEFPAGTVRPAESTVKDADADDSVLIIGGPETITPDSEEPHSTKSPSSEPTVSPSTAAPKNSTAPPDVSQAGNKTSSPSPTSATSMPMLTRTPTPKRVSSTPVPAQSAANPTPSSPPPHGTLPPQPQSPQAVEAASARHEKSWPLIVLVGVITAVATVVAILLWRDTRVPKRRTLSENDITHHKTASGDVEYDWYESSPSLSNKDDSVDTFMGRRPTRVQSDPHVSSRAASTADLLNVSTVGDRSTRSNTSSQSIPDQRDERNWLHQSMDVETHHATEDLSHHHNESRGRFSSSPRVSFDDEMNAVADWSGSDIDASVQAIFDEHYHAFMQPPSSTTAYAAAAAGSAAMSPTSTDGRGDVASDRGSDDRQDSSDEEERASERTTRRYSNGSAYSAVPSCSIGFPSECSYNSSPSSDWSDLTTRDSDCGSNQSFASQDEEI